MNDAPTETSIDNADKEFDWFKEQESIILECQAATAVYRNGRNHVVIRAEGRDYDEDSFIFLANDDAVKALIAALQRELRGSPNG